jgi:GDP-4-dehydro-6-deoxy-D-mannose reductase
MIEIVSELAQKVGAMNDLAARLRGVIRTVRNWICKEIDRMRGHTMWCKNEKNVEWSFKNGIIMKTVLITGASGFVAHHLTERMLNSFDIDRIVGVDISNPTEVADDPDNRCIFRKVNLLDRAAIDEIILETQPTYIIHLASFSSVAFSWENPMESFLNNTNIFLNIVDSVRRLDKSGKVLSIGSSESYGRVGPADLPLSESAIARPTSPYGAARVSQEMLSKVYFEGFGLDIVMTRSFNHFGPYQRDAFVIPTFVKQFVNAELSGAGEFHLQVGDIDVIRDFTDVRDVAQAYISLLESGRSGEIYNVCSGVGRRLGLIVEMLSEITGIRAIVVRDEEKIRPVENPVIVGDNTKITSDCGWSATRSFESTLIDTVAYWRKTLAC